MFEHIWNVFPTSETNSSKKKSLSKFEQIENLEDELPHIVDGIKRYISFIEHQRKNGFHQRYQQLTRWLNEEGWKIEYNLVEVAEKKKQRSNFGQFMADSVQEESTEGKLPWLK